MDAILSASIGLFPSIITGRIVDQALIGNDMVLLTDCLDHKTYYKYISTIRVQKKRFGYIHSVNIENNIKQFKEELM